jgi:hypothetical protein
LETEAYIFRILAAKMILSNPAAYGYIIPEARRYPPLQYDQVDIDLAKETAILIIARACDTSFKMIKEMNPEILRDSLPAGHFSIRIPKGKAEKFKAALTCLR